MSAVAWCHLDIYGVAGNYCCVETGNKGVMRYCANLNCYTSENLRPRAGFEGGHPVENERIGFKDEVRVKRLGTCTRTLAANTL